MENPNENFLLIIVSDDDEPAETSSANVSPEAAPAAEDDEAVETNAPNVSSEAAPIAEDDEAVETNAPNVSSEAAPIAEDDEAVETNAPNVSQEAAPIAEDDEAVENAPNVSPEAAHVHVAEDMYPVELYDQPFPDMDIIVVGYDLNFPADLNDRGGLLAGDDYIAEYRLLFTPEDREAVYTLVTLAHNRRESLDALQAAENYSLEAPPQQEVPTSSSTSQNASLPQLPPREDTDAATTAEAISSEKPTKFDCGQCGKYYATSSNLSRHKQTHRSLNSELAQRCTDCNKVYVSMSALAMHTLTHRMRHACGVCGKLFSRPWLLRGHLRSHTGEKPYQCIVCGKSFADHSNLRAHLQTHSPDKKFECMRCHKTFTLKTYLNKHQESACARHTNT